MELYRNVNYNCSKLITQAYSTSFTLGIKTLDPRFHAPIYAIYGMVRYADEIVDTFHGFDQEKLLNEFIAATFQAIEERISLNPVLDAFQETVHRYQIDHELIRAFFRSMEMDLYQEKYNRASFEEYIYGSAEVVGLMCLQVFVEGNKEKFDELKDGARALGAAFQKINFLRDLKADYQELGRTYFPGVDFAAFDEGMKSKIEAEIQQDFEKAYQAILRLPKGARLGVYLAYIYYVSLFRKIKKVPASRVMNERIRVPDNKKLALLAQTWFRHKLNNMQPWTGIF
ncbi:MAG: phytoene/squalene synthase family protein [Bacteroidia bacterium]|nr:phytoene/squalene synthase family protein [Bacteroidia bacterium]